MFSDDDAQDTVNSNRHRRRPLNLRCGLPALERLIARQLVSLGLQHDPAAPITLLVDLPYGFALRTLEQGASPKVKVVVLTWNTCPEYLEDLWAFQPTMLFASMDFDAELAKAVERAATGERYRAMPGGPSKLTPRERQVLQGVAHDRSNYCIARHLGITEKTFKNRLSGIYAQLHLTDRVTAALYYWGILDLLK